MSVLQSNIKVQLTELLNVLSNADHLINGHVGSFFTNHLWSKALPSEVRSELHSFSNFSQFENLYLKFVRGENCVFENYPKLKCFLDAPLNLSILKDHSCVTLLSEIENKMLKYNVKFNTAPALKDFMTVKKIHEVKKMIPLTEALTEFSKSQQVVDIGGGKGYLSGALIKQCPVSVLSLDSSSLTTCGAAKLKKKIDKSKKHDAQYKGLCHHDTVLVNRTTNLSNLMHKNLSRPIENAGIIGLHTCGNLALTCLHLFLQRGINWIINVGCCYHLIDEEFYKHPFWQNCDIEMKSEFGFPASKFLRGKNVKLGRNARMLAAHSLTRISYNGTDEKSAKSLFYRAILQVLIERVRGHNLVEGQVGRLSSKCENFTEYIRRGMRKLRLEVDISDHDIQTLLNEFLEQEDKLKIFFLLRTHFALALESVMLLDRLLFLHEEGIDNAYLVPLFDPLISPRNHAIVAWKTEVA